MPLFSAPSPSLFSAPSTLLASRAPAAAPRPFMAPSAKEKIPLFSPKFYMASVGGGIAACGLTHTAVTPLDLVKCNMQTDPVKYSSIPKGFGLMLREGGLMSLTKGWGPTMVGYSVQGAGKFGLYEFFKKFYCDQVGYNTAKEHPVILFLAASASAEFFADIGLCPFEAVKVRVQTQPGFANGMGEGLPKIINAEGFGALYKGLVPLWCRQIPYTMMKFACFEKVAGAIYENVLGSSDKSKFGKSTQLGVSFAAGYIAGVFCAIVSHPADNLVSKLNQKKGATVGEIVNEMGMGALFTRGLPLRIIMIGTLTGLQWGIYDAFKVAVGLPPTGGVKDLEAVCRP